MKNLRAGLTGRFSTLHPQNRRTLPERGSVTRRASPPVPTLETASKPCSPATRGGSQSRAPAPCQDAPQCPPLPGAPSARLRILVVEDEHDLRQLTSALLTDAGYEVEVAENGAAAWSALQRSRYDLLFTDQFMPKLSGVQLLKKIHDARLPVPVIMATGFLPTWEFSLHTWLQPVEMLLKPYSFANLLGMVQHALPVTPRPDEAASPIPSGPAQPSLTELVAG